MRRLGGKVLQRLGDSVAGALYPPACMVCADSVADAQMLCAPCWADAHLIAGAVCDCCGTPMPMALRPGDTIHCDTCLHGANLWDRGRAAALYAGSARALLLALKHGDRPEIARVLGGWMARAAAELLEEADVVVPIPLHWRRFLTRRYNQSAELSRVIARRAGRPHAPDMLHRIRPTEMQRARSASARARNVKDAFAVPRHMRDSVRNSRIVLIDDVLTTGATLNAATKALRAAGARQVSVAVFARVQPSTEF